MTLRFFPFYTPQGSIRYPALRVTVLLLGLRGYGLEEKLRWRKTWKIRSIRWIGCGIYRNSEVICSNRLAARCVIHSISSLLPSLLFVVPWFLLPISYGFHPLNNSVLLHILFLIILGCDESESYCISTPWSWALPLREIPPPTSDISQLTTLCLSWVTSTIALS